MGTVIQPPNRQDPLRRPGDADRPAGARTNAPRESSWTNGLIALVLAGLAVGYGFFVFLPNQKAIEALRREVATKFSAVEAGRNLADALADMRRKLAAARAHNAAWERDCPDRDELAALFGKMTALARAAQVDLQRFDPQPMVVRERLSTVPVEMEFSGSFREAFTFLRDLERLPQKIWIRSMKIGRIDGSAKTVGCKIILDVFSDNPRDSDQEDRSG